LPEIKSAEDISENIDKILYQYANREIASIQVEEYLNENNSSFVKEFLAKNEIDSREKLKKYSNNRQAKIRAGKGKERSELLRSIKILHLNFKKSKSL
jgi:hypothetical protein